MYHVTNSINYSERGTMPISLRNHNKEDLHVPLFNFYKYFGMRHNADLFKKS